MLNADDSDALAHQKRILDTYRQSIAAVVDLYSPFLREELLLPFVEANRGLARAVEMIEAARNIPDAVVAIDAGVIAQQGAQIAVVGFVDVLNRMGTANVSTQQAFEAAKQELERLTRATRRATTQH